MNIRQDFINSIHINAIWKIIPTLLLSPLSEVDDQVLLCEWANIELCVGRCNDCSEMERQWSHLGINTEIKLAEQCTSGNLEVAVYLYNYSIHLHSLWKCTFMVIVQMRQLMFPQRNEEAVHYMMRKWQSLNESKVNFKSSGQLFQGEEANTS